MSNKSKLKTPKVRNEFVIDMRNRGGNGPHGKSKKALRRDDKMQLRKEM